MKKKKGDAKLWYFSSHCKLFNLLFPKVVHDYFLNDGPNLMFRWLISFLSLSVCSAKGFQHHRMTNGAMNVEIGNPAYKIYEGDPDDDAGELLDSDFALDPDKVTQLKALLYKGSVHPNHKKTQPLTLIEFYVPKFDYFWSFFSLVGNSSNENCSERGVWIIQTLLLERHTQCFEDFWSLVRCWWWFDFLKQKNRENRHTIWHNKHKRHKEDK